MKKLKLRLKSKKPSIVGIENLVKKANKIESPFKFASARQDRLIPKWKSLSKALQVFLKTEALASFKVIKF